MSEGHPHASLRFFALTVFLSAATIAEAAAITRAPAASTNDVILAQSTDDDSPNFYSGNNRDRQRRARFVCVITPPDSANRRRPYICPLERGRVGGACRCSGVVGNGTVDTVW
ncbi:hypothetical protein EGT36_10225 [Agrobacterium sp. FDAARGOS_525]|uniref:hypothetical protein n=1 Tax=Agrobacterium sp. FDAARGOS_525 TaxID=2420311 RepID=UPI000F66C565|nr:hypothetical protein [Agrobacterium sp. FDAARGOS_525]RSC37579.1 hypothetical protein EGT36_10225 [Agrobacterium sp. FDAARGOS_525]